MFSMHSGLSIPILHTSRPQQLKQLKQEIAESLFLVGWLEIRMNEEDSQENLVAASRRAVDHWNRIPNFHRQSIPALSLWIADAWDRAKEPELAASARRKAANKKDEALLDFYVRGEYERARDDDQKAVESFSEALRIDPGHIWSLLAISHSLGQIGKSDVAEAHAIHALDRHPSSRAAYYGTRCQPLQPRKVRPRHKQTLRNSTS